MNTWFYVSICLYLLGAYYGFYFLKSDPEPSPLVWNVIGAFAWPILVLFVMGEGLWDLIKYTFKRVKMKYFVLLLIVGLFSCNDGGSDPELVKTDSAKNNYHFDTTGIIRGNGFTVTVGSSSIFQIPKEPLKKKKIIGKISYLKKDDPIYLDDLVERGVVQKPVDLDTTGYTIYGTRTPNESVANVGWASYDVIINSPQKGIVAYLKPDSAWVIKDSAEAFRMMLYMLEQQVKMYRK